MALRRIDVISDTHGRLSRELLDALDGCDLIVHAGDITSEDDFITLKALAPLRMCLGNNDWAGEYGPEVKRLVRFEYEGLRFSVTHYRENLTGEHCDVGVCGHTHVPEIVERANGSIIAAISPSGMPGPSSSIRMTAWRPSRTSDTRARSP